MAESRREKDLDLVEDFETVRAVTADGKSVQVPKSKFGGNLEVATENVLGGIKASAKSESDTQEVKIDPATGKLYCPPSELSIATADKLGGIVADAKTSEETEEVKVDPNTGKAYVKPSSKLDLATSDTLGGIKASPKVDSDTNEVRIDTKTGKLYYTPTETGIATSDTFGGIKAEQKTEAYTVEAKIDTSTGKLYVPEGEGTPPDDEDITIATVNESKVLQFKNKSYDAASYSGLGRTYLRKNMVSGVNVLTQSMLPTSNTRYIIQYDYDLNGATITIQEGCVLDFQGGSISNGSIVGNSTHIAYSGTNIFKDVSIKGTWNISELSDTMFEINEGDVDNNTITLNSLFALSSDGIQNNIYIVRNYMYYPNYDGGLNVTSNTTVSGGGSITVAPNPHAKYKVFNVQQKENILIENLTLVGDLENHKGTDGEQGFGIHIKGSNNVVVRECNISKFWGDGVDIQKAIWEAENETSSEVDYEYHNRNVLVENCNISYNRRNNISVECGFDIIVRGCDIGYAGVINGTLPMSGIDIEPIAENYQIVKDITIERCNIHDSAKYGIMVSTPTNNEGFIEIKDSIFDNMISWASSSVIDLKIIGCTQTVESNPYLYSGGTLSIENCYQVGAVIKSSFVKLSYTKFKTVTITGVTLGEIFKCDFYDSFYISGCSNIDIDLISAVNVGFNGVSENINFRDCKITTSNKPLISFESSAKLIGCNFFRTEFNGNATNTYPFTGISYTSSNSYLKDCRLFIKYDSDYSWLPFDNFVNCRIEAEKIRLLHENVYCENCSFFTSNPIRILDVSNLDDVQYVFDNTTVNGTANVFDKATASNKTYVKILGGIARDSVGNDIFYTEDSWFKVPDEYYSNTTRIFSTLVSASDRSACFRIPIVTNGKVIIEITPSYRWTSIKRGQKIVIDIANKTPTISYIGSSDTSINNVSVISEFSYPMYRMLDESIEIHLLNNKRNVDANAEIILISESPVVNKIDASWTAKVDSSLLTNILSYLRDSVFDTTDNIKSLDVSRYYPVLAYSTDAKKQLWWTGDAWVDSTGAEI